MPEIPGSAASVGALPRAATTPVAADVAATAPALFDAFTTTRRRWPTSAALTRYDEPDAPEMVAQLLPAESQRSQLYA